MSFTTRHMIRALSAVLFTCATASCLHAQASVGAPVMPAAVRQPTRATALVSATTWTVRAPDRRRAEHIAPTRDDWRIRIDSAPEGVLHTRWSSRLGGAASMTATVRLRVTDGVLEPPEVIPQPLIDRPFLRIGRTSAVLEPSQQERMLVHDVQRTMLEYAALFESGPPTALGARRTVHVETGEGNVRLLIDATRVGRSLRDTVVSGRRARVVRDSSSVTMTRAYLVPSRFTTRVGRVREFSRGTIVGVRLIDAESQRAFLMRDTLTMTGTLDADDAFGGRVQSPLFVRSVREASMRDSLWQALTPVEPLDLVRYDGARYVAPSAAVLESLLVRLRTAPAVSTRDSIRGLLAVRGGEAFWPRTAAISLAVGDTMAVVDRISTNASYTNQQVSLDDYAVIRATLRDASSAFRTGVDRERTVVNLLDGLLRRLPVLASSDSASACAPAACRAMMRDAHDSGGVALQALGLVAGMVTQPRVWTDSVVHYARQNPFLSTRAYWFARGTSSTAVASAKDEIPAPDAPYATWSHWFIGEDSAYRRALEADSIMSRVARDMRRSPTIRVSDAAALAIRFAEVRTGSSYGDAFRRARASATTDSVQGLFTAMLLAMGNTVFTTADLTRLLLGDAGAEREAARMQMRQTLREPMALAGDSLASVVGRHLVNLIFADSAIAMAGTNGQPPPRISIPHVIDSLTRYVSMDSLPPAVRKRAAQLGFVPQPIGWGLTPGEAGYIIRVHPIRVRGPFVRVSVTQSQLYARTRERSGGYAAGFTLTLIEGPAGWIIVDTESWIT